MFTCTGAIQVGRIPFVSSSKKAINLSIDPRIALWITTGVCFSPFSSMYERSKFLGSKKSNCTVGMVTAFPTAGLTKTSNFGP